MRCNNCPAYRDASQGEGAEGWGCICEPEKGATPGRLFKNGSRGCNRRREYILEFLRLFGVKIENPAAEAKKAYMRAYYRANKERYRAYARENYRKNRARAILRANKWRRENPEKSKAIVRKRNARKKYFIQSASGERKEFRLLREIAAELGVPLKEVRAAYTSGGDVGGWTIDLIC